MGLSDFASPEESKPYVYLSGELRVPRGPKPSKPRKPESLKPTALNPKALCVQTEKELSKKKPKALDLMSIHFGEKRGKDSISAALGDEDLCESTGLVTLFPLVRPNPKPDF